MYFPVLEIRVLCSRHRFKLERLYKAQSEEKGLSAAKDLPHAAPLADAKVDDVLVVLHNR